MLLLSSNTRDADPASTAADLWRADAHSQLSDTISYLITYHSTHTLPVGRILYEAQHTPRGPLSNLETWKLTESRCSSTIHRALAFWQVHYRLRLNPHIALTFGSRRASCTTAERCEHRLPHARSLWLRCLTRNGTSQIKILGFENV